MTRRRVNRIQPISATAPPSPVSACQTNSILTDPDGRWVAARQSAITAGLERRLQQAKAERQSEMAPRFSGENDRIGKQADDEKRFGDRVFYI